MPQVMVSLTPDEHAAITAEAEAQVTSASNIFRIAKGLKPLRRHRFTQAEGQRGTSASPVTKRADKENDNV